MSQDESKSVSVQAKETFYHFVSTNNEQIWKVVSRYVAIQNLPLDHAQDVYQIALGRVWKRWGDDLMRCEPEHQLACVYKAMQYVVREERRRVRSQKAHHIALDAVEGMSVDEDVAERAIGRTHLAILQRALLELPEKDRIIIGLAAAGVQARLIGDQVGLTADNVRIRLKRARDRLRRTLDPEVLHTLEIDAKDPKTTGGAA
ncbi:sigma-70 family RNA polymerase sigma factor [Amycolatopsis sp. cmx-4-68]|uniref:sigma-70 family RNA polymerase sigma factor n=1 Tax=Amycolatopsis sp. cmx-4-68 TaxID=2790938 RepID=UPI00397B6A3F